MEISILDGRHWNELSIESKSIYLNGLLNGMNVARGFFYAILLARFRWGEKAISELKSLEVDNRGYVLEAGTLIEAIRLIDIIYEDGKNLRLPVYAIRALASRMLAGKTMPYEVENELVSLRNIRWP